jgi:hypothetical protein
MIPTWMIDELERQRREREQKRPQPRIELPVHQADERPPHPAPPWRIVVELGDGGPAA